MIKIAKWAAICGIRVWIFESFALVRWFLDLVHCTYASDIPAFSEMYLLFFFSFFFFFDLPIFNSHTLYLLHLPPLLAKLIAQYEQSAFTAISYMIRMFALYNVSDDIDSKLWMSCCSALDFKSISQIIHIWLILSKADNFT